MAALAVMEYIPCTKPYITFRMTDNMLNKIVVVIFLIESGSSEMDYNLNITYCRKFVRVSYNRSEIFHTYALTFVRNTFGASGYIPMASEIRKMGIIDGDRNWKKKRTDFYIPLPCKCKKNFYSAGPNHPGYEYIYTTNRANGQRQYMIFMRLMAERINYTLHQTIAPVREITYLDGRTPEAENHVPGFQQQNHQTPDHATPNTGHYNQQTTPSQPSASTPWQNKYTLPGTYRVPYTKNNVPNPVASRGGSLPLSPQHFFDTCKQETNQKLAAISDEEMRRAVLQYISAEQAGKDNSNKKLKTSHNFSPGDRDDDGSYWLVMTGLLLIMNVCRHVVQYILRLSSLRK